MNAKAIPSRETDLSALVFILAGLAGRSARLEMTKLEPLRRSASTEQKEHRASSVKREEADFLGYPIDQNIDPHALEVHRPIQLEGAPEGLPHYLPRAHDTVLHEALRTPEPSLLVLVGGSSTGKTRAAYEAVRKMTGWSLYHPIFPNRATALVEALNTGRLAPKTVIWLNELQEYLMRDGGEAAAASLRRALSDSSEPLKFVATIWPRYWQAITELDSPYPSGRELLNNQAVRFDINSTFPAELLSSAAANDNRIQVALKAAPKGITQYLAAGPALLDFFRDSKDENPGAWAILCTAMDANIGEGTDFLTAEFLSEAAPGYMTDEEWGACDEDWFERALNHATTELRGAARPLSKVRPRTESSGRVHFRLADYLVQHAQQTRAEAPVPRSLWSAILSNVKEPLATSVFAQSAGDRGMYEEAAQLWTPLAHDGDAQALHELLKNPTVPSEEAEALMKDAIDAIPLSETVEIGWMLSELQQQHSLKERLVQRVSEAPDQLQIGPPFDMFVIFEELELAGHDNALRVYSQTIKRDLKNIDRSDFWNFTSLSGALLGSDLEDVLDTGIKLARIYFKNCRMKVTELSYFLAHLSRNIHEGDFTDEVRAELHARVGEIDISDVISLHPAIVNLLLAGESKLGHSLLTRACNSITELDLGRSYAPLELMYLMRDYGYIDGMEALACRVAEEFDPGRSGPALHCLEKLDAIGCEAAFSIMAHRMARTGPILPVAHADKLSNFFATKGLAELHEIYAQRLRDFRTREGAETL
ncbi:hypothetical protein [Streptomyces sp. NPDC087317]|uniref:hypothetical protein n=1 Tax=Streptomyces sp. NPDC087317 TaxID=3365784 RepID=UPI0038244931